MTVDRFGNSPDKHAEPRYPAPTAPARPRNRAREKGRQPKLTAPAYWKFESIFLQRRVYELSVPLEMRGGAS
jgi:hypothetical protein